jgi:hypothetical protein
MPVGRTRVFQNKFYMICEDTILNIVERFWTNYVTDFFKGCKGFSRRVYVSCNLVATWYGTVLFSKK